MRIVTTQMAVLHFPWCSPPEPGWVEAALTIWDHVLVLGLPRTYQNKTHRDVRRENLLSSRRLRELRRFGLVNSVEWGRDEATEAGANTFTWLRSMEPHEREFFIQAFARHAKATNTNHMSAFLPAGQTLEPDRLTLSDLERELARLRIPYKLTGRTSSLDREGVNAPDLRHTGVETTPLVAALQRANIAMIVKQRLARDDVLSHLGGVDLVTSDFYGMALALLSQNTSRAHGPVIGLMATMNLPLPDLQRIPAVELAQWHRETARTRLSLREELSTWGDRWVSLSIREQHDFVESRVRQLRDVLAQASPATGKRSVSAELLFTAIIPVSGSAIDAAVGSIGPGTVGGMIAATYGAFRILRSRYNSVYPQPWTVHALGFQRLAETYRASDTIALQRALGFL